MNKTCISQLNLDLISLLCKADELECFHKDTSISILLCCTSQSKEQGTEIITRLSPGLAKLCAGWRINPRLGSSSGAAAGLGKGNRYMEQQSLVSEPKIIQQNHSWKRSVLSGRNEALKNQHTSNFLRWRPFPLKGKKVYKLSQNKFPPENCFCPSIFNRDF